LETLENGFWHAARPYARIALEFCVLAILGEIFLHSKSFIDVRSIDRSAILAKLLTRADRAGIMRASVWLRQVVLTLRGTHVPESKPRGKDFEGYSFSVHLELPVAPIVYLKDSLVKPYRKKVHNEITYSPGVSRHFHGRADFRLV